MTPAFISLVVRCSLVALVIALLLIGLNRRGINDGM